MIDILLNPDNETVGGETLEGVTDHTGSSKNLENLDNELIAILTAEKLVKVTHVLLEFCLSIPFINYN
jgi:hypothetical protein